MYIFNNSYSYRDIGLLILRIGIGIMFVLHGLPKIMGGAEKWESIGLAMKYFGIQSNYIFWGYLAAFAEVGGGILLMFGLVHRFVCIMLLFTMIVAATKHILQGDPINKSYHAIEAAILFFSFLLIGPGRISLDQMLFGKDK